MSLPETEKVAKEINAFLKKLDIWATLLQVLTVILTVTAIIASLAVGFFVGELNPIQIKFMALAAAFCTASISALQLEKKARDMREGYRYLQHAIYKYKTGLYNIEALVNAYLETEKIVGHIELNEESIRRLMNIQKNGQ